MCSDRSAWTQVPWMLRSHSPASVFPHSLLKSAYVSLRRAVDFQISPYGHAQSFHARSLSLSLSLSRSLSSSDSLSSCLTVLLPLFHFLHLSLTPCLPFEALKATQLLETVPRASPSASVDILRRVSSLSFPVHCLPTCMEDRHAGQDRQMGRDWMPSIRYV